MSKPKIDLGGIPIIGDIMENLGLETVGDIFSTVGTIVAISKIMKSQKIDTANLTPEEAVKATMNAITEHGEEFQKFMIEGERMADDAKWQAAKERHPESVGLLTGYDTPVLGDDGKPVMETVIIDGKEVVRPKVKHVQGSMERVGQSRRDEYERDVTGRAGADVDALTWSGQDMAGRVKGIAKAVDPEYFDTRALQAKKLGQLLGGMDPNRLSGAERAEVSRSLGRQGVGLGAGSPMDTIAAAMTFGSALDRKRAALGQALNSATAYLPASRMGYDPLMATVGRTSSPPTTAYAPNLSPPSASASSYGAGTNVLNMVGGLQGAGIPNTSYTLNPYGEFGTLFGIGGN